MNFTREIKGNKTYINMISGWFLFFSVLRRWAHIDILVGLWGINSDCSQVWAFISSTPCGLTWARFLSLARSKLRLCSANHRPGYWSNLPCDWPSTDWAYSEKETENGPCICSEHWAIACKFCCISTSRDFSGAPNKLIHYHITCFVIYRDML